MRLHPQVISLLNPVRVDAIPAGFSRHRITLTAGLPQPLPMAINGIDAAILLIVPSGRIRRWLTLDAGEAFASGSDQRDAWSGPATGATAFANARAQASPYLMVLIDRKLGDLWPLSIGPRRIISGPRDGGKAVVAELMVLDFRLNPSALTGGAPSGCWIDLATRPLGPTDAFRVPMVRVPPQQLELARDPDSLTLAMQFDSAIDAQPQPDGTPLGGLNWWQATGHG